jgi:catechol-2,3-dioxygenase
MVKPVMFAHVVYQTRRYDEMIRWYQDVFEAEVVSGGPVLSFLTYDDEHHRFAIANLDVLRPGSSEKDRQGDVGVNHVAYTFATPTALLRTYKRLKKKGILPYWPVHHGVTLSLYYKDPDGNRMEFQVDCGSKSETLARLSTEAFAANPVGVGYDPDLLLARMEGGEGDATLVLMPEGPPAAIPAEHGLT